MLIAHALAGSAYQSAEPPAIIAKRAIQIAGAVLGQLAREAEEHERRQRPPLSESESAALLRKPSRGR
jgi:hypothetical protein